MSKTKWTQAQKCAIDDRGGALLVSAAAGSGKTAVLTERVLELLKDIEHPVQAERLLIVTFTNAAAAELRARIALRIEEELISEPTNQHLRRQKMRLARAHICTIDAFCLDLLRRHFSSLDIPPDFTTADAGTVEMLKNIALSETLEIMVKETDFCNFADLYGRGRSDDIAAKSILQLHGFLSAMPFPQERLNDFLVDWKRPFASSAWKTALVEKLLAIAEGGCELAEGAKRFSEQDLAEERIIAQEKGKTANAKEKNVQKINEKFATVHQCLAELAEAFTFAKTNLETENGWDFIYNKFEFYRTGEIALPGIAGKNMRLVGENKATVKAQATQAGELFEEFLELLSCSEAEAEEDRKIALPMVSALLKATALFSEIFYKKKLEKKMLEFSDFEQLALKLLSEKDGEKGIVAKGICDDFDAVMVDEYQDTNALQDAIYSLLGGENGKKLFYVGDLKQSIYRFRQADPFIFATKQSAFTQICGGQQRAYPEIGQIGTPALIALDANFRSALAVVQGVNFLFEELMNEHLGGTQYGDGQRLVCGAPSEFEGEVSLLIDTEKENDPEQVAKKINQLMELGKNGDKKGFVRAKNGTRPVRYEDFCLLLATRTSFVDYQQALEKAGIPVYADSADDLLESAHIRPIVALLKIIDNPAQDIPLAAAMISPLFGFTEDDLVAIRLQKKKGSLYGAVVSIAQKARLEIEETEQAKNEQNISFDDEFSTLESNAVENKDVFSQKILFFYESLSVLRRLSHSIPPTELLAEIFASTHYPAIVGAMENGMRRREELDSFASFVASAGANGIESLVRSIDALSASGGLKDTSPSGAKPGCVTIMTIHRSKGLQFPVVFVCQCQHRFNTDDIKGKILLHRNQGLGLQLRGQNAGDNYSTLARIAIKETLKEEMQSEQMRLLYVALTRAQDRLFVTMSVNSQRNLETKLAQMMAARLSNTAPLLHSGMSSFGDWILSALLAHPNGGKLREYSGNVNLIARDEKGKFDVEFFTSQEAKEQQGEKSNLLTATPDSALVEELKKGFAWEYPHAPLTKIPAKVSVTGVVHKKQNTVLSRPDFTAKDGLSATERGTAMHAFLQYANFEFLAKEKQKGDAQLLKALETEVSRQQAEQLLPSDWAKHLDTESLSWFFLGEVFVRMCDASEILREYDFITGLPASVLFESDDEIGNKKALSEKAENATVLVQGIADVVLVFEDHIELLDYKSDRGKTPEEFKAHYAQQLEIYARAIEKRFTPKKVTYTGIYSIALKKLIEISL